MTLQGLHEEQLAAFLASGEQLRCVDDLPYASINSGNVAASGASAVTQPPAPPTLSTGSTQPD